MKNTNGLAKFLYFLILFLGIALIVLGIVKFPNDALIGSIVIFVGAGVSAASAVNLK